MTLGAAGEGRLERGSKSVLTRSPSAVQRDSSATTAVGCGVLAVRGTSPAPRRFGLGVRAMLRGGAGDAARQAVELGEHRVAPLLEVRDDLLDVAAAPVGLLDDPLRLALGRFAGVRRVRLGLVVDALRLGLRLGPRLVHVLVGLRADLPRVGVGLLAHLRGVLVGAGAQPLDGHVGVDQLLARVVRRVGANRLGGVVSLGEDAAGLLVRSARAPPNGLHRGVILASALKPVGELAEELVDLAAVISAYGVRESGVSNALQ